MHVHVGADPSGWAARWIARRLRAAAAARGLATLALSGGSTAPPMLALLADVASVPWDEVGIWQVDERVAPDGDRDRNASQLDAFPGRHHLMPVTAKDLRTAADRYAAGLPDRFDVVHLGIGPDGHTASWPPGDPVIDSDRPVDLCGPFNGRMRMTLTPPVVNGARARIVLAPGADKVGPLADWIERREGCADLPVSRVRRTATVVAADQAAAAGLERST